MLRRLVWTFAVTQTVGYGVLFYAFGVYVTPIAADLGTNRTTVTGAMTVSILITALAAVPVGRWLDRRGGRALMVPASALGVLAVVIWSQVTTVWQLYLAFVLIGLGSAAVLYEAAFAVVVKHSPPAARSRSILIITICAGFASTIFVPLAGMLGERLGWRTALLILAGVLAVATVIPHAIVVPANVARADAHGPGIAIGVALRDPTFWLLTIGFTASGAGVFSMAIHLFAYLRGLGHPATAAAVVAGLTGVTSVTGRMVCAGLSTRYQTINIVAIFFAVQGLAGFALPWAGHTLLGAIVCVLLFGLGFGVANIAKPELLARRYGAGEFAGISGVAAVPATVAKATAPVAVVALSLTCLPILAGAACLLAATCLAAAGRTSPLPMPAGASAR